MGFAPSPVGPGFDFANTLVSGLSSVFAKSDPAKDRDRCDTAARAVAAARGGAPFLVNGVAHDPLAWVRAQAASSASDAGKKCYGEALAQLQAGPSVSGGAGGMQLTSLLPTTSSGMLVAVLVLTIVGVGAFVVLRKAGRPA